MPNKNTMWSMLAGAGIGIAGSALLWRMRDPDWTGKVVLITGGSRGLGFLLAREFSRHGCRIVICARDSEELSRARDELESQGADLLALPCDVSDPDSVNRMIGIVAARYGQIDALVNNAGIIQVGPVESMTIEDFEHAMAINFWGVVRTTLAVLPGMLERGEGSIVNITSIGGKVAVPHLLPYTCAKFAAVGFSEGLRAEVAGKGVCVTTIVPGLMRTGSYVHAVYKGQQEKESAWFGVSSSLPLLTINAERAARQIVRAAKRGDAERVLTAPANLLAKFHGLFPGATNAQLGLVNDALLPSSEGGTVEPAMGKDVMDRSSSWMLEAMTALGRQAGRRLHQYET